MSSCIVYLNGQFLPIEQAQISVMDRGFLFGDGVYEVIPMFAGKLFLAAAHLKRLQASLAAISLSLPPELDITTIIEQLILHNPDQGENRAIYLQITRGAPAAREHTFPAPSTPPTVFLQSTIFTPTPEAVLRQGARAITVPDIRWQHCYIKAIILLPNILGAEQAKQQDAKEVIWIRNGMALEGASSNLFTVKDDVLYTPPADKNILCGITRNFILTLAKQEHIPFKEQIIPQASLRQADEVWMTGSLKEILPITHIDDYAVGEGKVGPLWQRVFTCYQRRYCR